MYGSFNQSSAAASPPPSCAARICCGQLPTENSKPDMPAATATSEATRSGWTSVKSIAIRPPSESPMRCALAMPSASRTASRSSTSEYGSVGTAERP